MISWVESWNRRRTIVDKVEEMPIISLVNGNGSTEKYCTNANLLVLMNVTWLWDMGAVEEAEGQVYNGILYSLCNSTGSLLFFSPTMKS